MDNFELHQAAENAEFAHQMMEKFKALLLKCAAFDSITVDGQTVKYRDIEQKLEYWQNIWRRAFNPRRRVVPINLGNF